MNLRRFEANPHVPAFLLSGYTITNSSAPSFVHAPKTAMIKRAISNTPVGSWCFHPNDASMFAILAENHRSGWPSLRINPLLCPPCFKLWDKFSNVAPLAEALEKSSTLALIGRGSGINLIMWDPMVRLSEKNPLMWHSLAMISSSPGAGALQVSSAPLFSGWTVDGMFFAVFYRLECFLRPISSAKIASRCHSGVVTTALVSACLYSALMCRFFVLLW